MLLFIDIVINIIDIFMIFCILSGLTFHRHKISILKLCEIIILGTFNGLLLTYSDETKFKFVIYIIMIIILKFEIKEKIDEVLILFVCIIVIMGIVQVSVNYFFKPYINQDDFTFIIPQVFTAVIVIIISKFPLFKVANWLRKQILIKYMFFMITIVFLVITHKDLYDINIENSFVLSVIMICLVGLLSVAKKIYYYTTIYPIVYHDMTNLLNSLAISTRHAKSYDELQKILNNFYDLIGVNIYSYKQASKNGVLEEFILEKVKCSENTNLSAKVDVKYIEDNSKITNAEITMIIGTLIDNAIEASPVNSLINTYIRVSEYHVCIRVDNFFFSDQIIDFIESLYSGKSSKSVYRGYGLNNVQKLARKYDGSILVYKKHNWIEITVEIFS